MPNKATLDGQEERDLVRATALPACAVCEHWDVGEQTCEAFPERIPDDIFRYGNDHRRPYPNDNGIRFTPLNKTPLDK